MCGRYVQTKRARDVARRLTGYASIPAPRPETWNLSPGTRSLIVRAWPDRLIEEWLSWGYRDAEAKQHAPINARVDSAPYVWLFREAWKDQRCVVPADGWYEWKEERGHKQPYYFSQRSGHPLFFAGLWTGTTFAILTTESDGDLSTVHQRRPIGLDLARAQEWIEEAPVDDKALVRKMLPAGEIAFRTVDLRVNSSREDGPGLIAPYTPPASQAQLGLL